jgi:hypothetical protein
MTVSVQRIWSCPKRSLDYALAFADQHRLGFLHIAFHLVDERGFPDTDRSGRCHEMAKTHVLHEVFLEMAQLLGGVKFCPAEVTAHGSLKF